MLLVELPEAEIPEKTRLSFAATKLIRLSECRLSNDARLVELACRRQAIDAKDKLSSEQSHTLENERIDIQKEWEKQDDKLNREVVRAFGLLRKVLQERPDRVRLWTRAIKMCRQTGVKGLKDIFCDIDKVEHDNPMAAEYLRANTLSLLGYESIIAALLVSNPEIAEWRRKAAQTFLNDITNTRQSQPMIFGHRWFLQKSWEQFCFGIFCSNLILKSSILDGGFYKCQLPKELIVLGEQFAADKTVSGYSQSLTWWAARLSLRDLSSRAPEWVVKIGSLIPPGIESYSFWRFFPFDVPPDILQGMIAEDRYSQKLVQMGGWWYDALSAKREIVPSLLIKGGHSEIACTLNNLKSTSDNSLMSLHEWCAEIREIRKKDTSDPRASEWTALEIVRQVGMSITKSQEFTSKYVADLSANQSSTLCLHPANFRVPREWITFKEMPTWDDWKQRIQPQGDSSQVQKVPDDLHVADFRYTPLLSLENTLFNDLFVWVNPVRGLGLLLYGLLRHDLVFPAVWNGPGHSDVLSFLPPRLLKEMTCSSLTLGLLLACLQSRAMENLKPSLGGYLDDDSLHDPVQLRTAEDVCERIEQCQKLLKRNQLSTINHRARQLTPISIRDLSNPDWSKAFESVQEGGGVDEQ